MSTDEFKAPDQGDSGLLAELEFDLLRSSACASRRALATCGNIAEAADPLIRVSNQLRSAVFPNDDGGLVFVVHSRLTKRQVTFEVSPDGNVTVISIDEALRRHEQPVGQLDVASVRQPIEWLVSRS